MSITGFVCWLLIATPSLALPMPQPDAPLTTTVGPTTHKILNDQTTEATLIATVLPPITIKSHTSVASASFDHSNPAIASSPVTFTATAASSTLLPSTISSAVVEKSLDRTKTETDGFTTATLAGTTSTTIGNYDGLVKTTEGLKATTTTSTKTTTTSTISTPTSTAAIVTREQFLTMNNVTKEELREGLPLPANIAKSLQTTAENNNDEVHEVNSLEGQFQDVEWVTSMSNATVDIISKRGKSEDFTDTSVPLLKPNATTTTTTTTTNATADSTTATTMTTTTTTTTTMTTTTITTTTASAATTSAIEKPEQELEKQSLNSNDTSEVEIHSSLVVTTGPNQFEESLSLIVKQNSTKVPTLCEEQWSEDRAEKYFGVISECDQVNQEKVEEVIPLPDGYTGWNNQIWATTRGYKATDIMLNSPWYSALASKCNLRLAVKTVYDACKREGNVEDDIRIRDFFDVFGEENFPLMKKFWRKKSFDASKTIANSLNIFGMSGLLDVSITKEASEDSPAVVRLSLTPSPIEFFDQLAQPSSFDEEHYRQARRPYLCKLSKKVLSYVKPESDDRTSEVFTPPPVPPPAKRVSEDGEGLSRKHRSIHDALPYRSTEKPGPQDNCPDSKREEVDALIEAELALYKAKTANIGKQDRQFKGVDQLQLLVPKMFRSIINFRVILERLSSAGDLLSLEETVFMVEEAVAVAFEMFGGDGYLADISTVANLLSMHSYNMVIEHMPKGFIDIYKEFVSNLTDITLPKSIRRCGKYMAQNLDLLISHDIYNKGLTRREQRIVDHVAHRIDKNAKRIAATLTTDSDSRNTRSTDEEDSLSASTKVVDIADILVKNSRKVGTSGAVAEVQSTNSNSTEDENNLVKQQTLENPFNEESDYMIEDDTSSSFPSPTWLYAPLHEVVEDSTGFITSVSTDRPIWNIIQVERFVKGWNVGKDVSYMDMQNLDLLSGRLIPSFIVDWPMIQGEGDEPALSFLLATRSARKLADIMEVDLDDLTLKIWLEGLNEAQRSRFVLQAHRSLCMEVGHPEKELDFAQWHKNRKQMEREEGRKRWKKYCHILAKQITDTYCTEG